MKYLLSNLKLVAVAAVALLVLIVTIFQSLTTDSDSFSTLESVPSAPNPDADSPVETIKTLTARVNDMTHELQSMRQSNQELTRQKRDIELESAQIEERVASQVSANLRRDLVNQSAATSRDREQIRVLEQRINELQSRLARQDRSSISPIPIGEGTGTDSPSPTRSEMAWVEPLGLLTTESAVAAHSAPFAADTQTTSANPVFTLPRNATLLDSVNLTALVGRVPIAGEVQDPMPFKVLNGSLNITANGLTLPGVRGMVWSGTAIGDWTMSCVRGRLHSVTFVFADGRIRTVASDTGTASQGGHLGWISDSHGVPCVPGRQISNAATYLRGQLAASAVEGAATAAASAETSRILAPSSSIHSAVTGDVGSYVLGETVASSSRALSDWLRARSAQHFDAVYSPAGQEVVIHIDQAVEIDYETSGRKLEHELDTSFGRTPYLD